MKALLTNAPECTLKVNRMFSFEWILFHFDFFYLMLRGLWTSYLRSSKLVRSFCQKQLTVSTSLGIKIAWALISFYETHQNTRNILVHCSTWGFRRRKKNGSIKIHDIIGSIIQHHFQNSFLKTAVRSAKKKAKKKSQLRNWFGEYGTYEGSELYRIDP